MNDFIIDFSRNNLAPPYPEFLDRKQRPLVEHRSDQRVHLAHVAAQPAEAEKGPVWELLRPLPQFQQIQKIIHRSQM